MQRKYLLLHFDRPRAIIFSRKYAQVQITELLQVLSCTLENARSHANTTAMLTVYSNVNASVRLYLGTVVLFVLNASCQHANLLTIWCDDVWLRKKKAIWQWCWRITILVFLASVPVSTSQLHRIVLPHLTLRLSPWQIMSKLCIFHEINVFLPEILIRVNTECARDNRDYCFRFWIFIVAKYLFKRGKHLQLLYSTRHFDFTHETSSSRTFLNLHIWFRKDFTLDAISDETLGVHGLIASLWNCCDVLTKSRRLS